MPPRGIPTAYQRPGDIAPASLGTGHRRPDIAGERLVIAHLRPGMHAPQRLIIHAPAERVNVARLACASHRRRGDVAAQAGHRPGGYAVCQRIIPANAQAAAAVRRRQPGLTPARASQRTSSARREYLHNVVGDRYPMYSVPTYYFCIDSDIFLLRAFAPETHDTQTDTLAGIKNPGGHCISLLSLMRLQKEPNRQYCCVFSGDTISLY